MNACSKANANIFPRTQTQAIKLSHMLDIAIKLRKPNEYKTEMVYL